jgi:hypothetical protein
MKTPEQIYKILRDNCLKVKNKGLYFVQNNFFDFGDGEISGCCLIGSLFVNNEMGIDHEFIENFLEINYIQRLHIIFGWDERSITDLKYKEYYEIGEKLRKEFYENQ